MKTSGIIGGLGPETTAEFYLKIIFGCYEKNQIQRPPILIWNVPLKYEIENDLLTMSEGEERYLPYLIEAVEKLEKGGADFLVMPCNSLHMFIGDIRKTVQIPVLSVLEETASFLRNINVSEVGVLATTTSVKQGLYEKALSKVGIKQILPDNFDQAKIGKIISNIVLNQHANRDREELLKIIDRLVKRGVKNIILACTDLQLLVPQRQDVKIYDTMEIFAQSTINKILEEK